MEGVGGGGKAWPRCAAAPSTACRQHHAPIQCPHRPCAFQPPPRTALAFFSGSTGPTTVGSGGASAASAAGASVALIAVAAPLGAGGQGCERAWAAAALPAVGVRAAAGGVRSSGRPFITAGTPPGRRRMPGGATRRAPVPDATLRPTPASPTRPCGRRVAWQGIGVRGRGGWQRRGGAGDGGDGGYKGRVPPAALNEPTRPTTLPNYPRMCAAQAPRPRAAPIARPRPRPPPPAPRNRPHGDRRRDRGGGWEGQGEGGVESVPWAPRDAENRDARCATRAVGPADPVARPPPRRPPPTASLRT